LSPPPRIGKHQLLPSLSLLASSARSVSCPNLANAATTSALTGGSTRDLLRAKAKAATSTTPTGNPKKKMTLHLRR
jgi:hypothetical protein